MAAVCHEIKETVGLERCKCGERYEQWGKRPAPPCSKCEKIYFRKASSGETGTEQGGIEGKRAKGDSSNGIGERKREKIQHPRILILVAFITGNSSLEPLIEGLYAQIHVNLR